MSATVKRMSATMSIDDGAHSRAERTPGLTGWLAIGTMLLVGVTVAAVSVTGIGLLRDLAEREALTRVKLAVSAAREGIRQSTEELSSTARVLGERPTLQRLLDEEDHRAVTPYLRRFCEGAQLDACAVVRDNEIFASVDRGLAWRPLVAAAAAHGERFLVALDTAQGATIASGASALVADRDASVLVSRWLDEAFVTRLGERTGLEMRLVNLAASDADAQATALLDTDALARGLPAAGRVPALDVYAASLPLATAGGETIALLQAWLPAADILVPIGELTRRLLLVALVVATLAIGCGILLGHYWIGGVRRLTGAARRIGAGDLSASIPAESGTEVGVLATTMEEMRRNLVALTGELRRREAEAQAVVDGIVEGVYAVDRERRIRFLNPRAEKLLGVSSAQVIGRFCGDVLNPAPDATGRRPCESACPILAARRAGSADAVELIEPVPGRIRHAVVASAAAEDGLQVQVLRDETELEAVRRTRDTVLANISHEFRTPLSAQLASIELLHDGLGHATLEQQYMLVESLERGARRLAWLVDNLLESVRIESGQLAIRRQDVAFDDVVQAARELVEPLLVQRGQRLESHVADALPPIRGDHQRLVQVLVNLLANASKFGPPDSVIGIGGHGTPDGGLAFWVEDDGPGPAEPDDATLFDRFRRAGGEDPRESGLGLGLFIVRSIVERHGGRVSLARTAASRTRAQVELPAEAPR